MRVFSLFPSLLLLTCLALLVPTESFRADTKSTKETKTIKPFRLADPDGKMISWADFKDRKAVVVLFLGTECPINNQYLPMLSDLHKKYSEKNVGFLAFNSNVHDTTLRVAAHAKTNKIPFPVIKDSANAVADDFGARRTPEAFVVSPAGKILYQGRIDDQIGIGYRRKEATRKDLEIALEETLAGKAVSTPLTEVAGCLIARVKKPSEKGSITYAKQVSRIIQNRCQECHRPGQVAPMPLMTYEDALSWQEMIEEVVTEKRMPPWNADPKHGVWENDRSLTKQERETLLGWIKQGCPKGDDKDLPAKKQWATDWTIGKPDVVFEMPREYTVPAKVGPRGVPYQYFTVPTNFDEDRWVEAAEARPGAREVVHHIIIYVFDKSRLGRRLGGQAQKNQPGTAAARRDGIGNGFLAAYAPGDMPLVLKPGQAKKLPKGAVLVFQMHYTPDGVERKDRSSVALRFAKKPPEHEVKTRAVAMRFFLIPPGAKNHEVQSRTTFDAETEIYSLLPHMHLRGKDFKYELVYPDGKRETILSVPVYDFNWQSTYRFKKPLRVPAGTKMECTAHFNNSEDNPNNPDPKKTVFWGDQTWEEMMIGFVDYAVVGKEKK